ncbi:MAG TPA: alpha-glucosidase C-terminal domain-containing protein, partial [Polyangiaceae bacterium]|nr:alpha-glucosidase C-terminal domain-containing protein [Polyangiaceae bacterium]
GPDENMQLYGRGLRRRLAPMLKGDLARLELAYSLMLSLPGTPVFWYGEEIGMGENLELPDRDAVRTPMQWTGARGFGFSKSSELVRPPVSSGPFTPQRVNVADQRRTPDSLLARVERLIRKRKECPEIGWGEAKVLNAHNQHVLAIFYTWQEGALLIVHNFSRSAQALRVDLKDAGAEELCDVFTGETCGGTRSFEIELPPSGFRWLRVGAGDRALREHHGRQVLLRGKRKS